MEPLITRLVATSVSIAHRAGRIVRDILSKGDLGIVEKVDVFIVMTVILALTRLR